MRGGGYGGTRGHNYNSNNREWNPLRGNNQQSQGRYSALYYNQQRNNHNNNNQPHIHGPQCNHNHNNHNHNHSSLHPMANTVSNQQNRPNPSNPYAVLNDPSRTLNTPYHPNHLYPDLTQQRKPPQHIKTPQKKRNNAKGWDFGAFSMVKSVWNKFMGTPSRSNNQSSRPRRESQSQPPPQIVQSPSNEHQQQSQQPPNPYILPSNQNNNNNQHTNNSIPEEHPISQFRAQEIEPTDNNNNDNTLNNADNGNNNVRHSNSVLTVPVTPPTRPSLSQILNQSQPLSSIATDSKTDDEHKSQHTATATDGGSAVISIHNLLQKTTLSPDDAAWLHSKIDAVTHDRDGGSLSWVGPTSNLLSGVLTGRAASVRAGSAQSVIQQIPFDDTADNLTEHSIYSPLRNRANPIPQSAFRSSRYQPHPGNYRKPSLRANNKQNNKVITVKPKTVDRRLRRKRGRNEMAMDEDEDDLMLNHEEQRKKKRKIHLSGGRDRKRAFNRNNYLRPMSSYQKYSTPQYNKKKGIKDKRYGSAQKPPMFDVTAIAEDDDEDNDIKAIDVDKTESNKNKKKEIESIQNGDGKKKKKEDSEAAKNGFCFNGGDEESVTVNNVMVHDNNDNSKRDLNGFGMGSHKVSEEQSEETSENVIMSTNNNKPLKKRRKSNRRSPLKDKHVDNDHNMKKNKVIKLNDDEDEDDDMLKKKDDSSSPLKKDHSLTPTSKTKQSSPHETPQSKAFENAEQMLTNNEIKKTPKKKTVITLNNDAQIQKKKELKSKKEEPKHKIIVTPPIKLNDDKKKEKHKNGLSTNFKATITKTPPKADKVTDNKQDEKKEPERPKETYLQKILRIRKERYLKAYRMRFERIYKEHQPSKLQKVDEFMKKYGADVDKLHDLYARVCNKYELRPYDKYEGQETDPLEEEDAKEKPKIATPENQINDASNNPPFSFNMDKDEDKKVDPNKENGQNSWGFNTDNKDENKAPPTVSVWGTGANNKEDKPPTFSWGMGNNNATATTTTDNKKKEEKKEKAKDQGTSNGFGSGTPWGFTQNTKQKEDKPAPKTEQKVNDEPGASNGGWNFSNTFGATNTPQTASSSDTVQPSFGLPDNNKDKPNNGGFNWSMAAQDNNLTTPKRKEEPKQAPSSAATWKTTDKIFDAPPTVFSIPANMSFDTGKTNNNDEQKPNGTQSAFGIDSNTNNNSNPFGSNTMNNAPTNNGFAATNNGFTFQPTQNTANSNKPSFDSKPAFSWDTGNANASSNNQNGSFSWNTNDNNNNNNKQDNNNTFGFTAPSNNNNNGSSAFGNTASSNPNNFSFSTTNNQSSGFGQSSFSTPNNGISFGSTNQPTNGLSNNGMPWGSNMNNNQQNNNQQSAFSMNNNQQNSFPSNNNANDFQQKFGQNIANTKVDSKGFFNNKKPARKIYRAKRRRK